MEEKPNYDTGALIVSIMENVYTIERCLDCLKRAVRDLAEALDETPPLTADQLFAIIRP